MRRGLLLGVGLILAGGCRKPAPPSDTNAEGTSAATVSAVPQAPPLTATAPSTSRELAQAAGASSRVASASPLAYERLTLGGDAKTPLPWIVALHGLGDTPRGFSQLFAGLPLNAHVYLIQAPMAYGAGFDWLGERVSGDPERLALAIAHRLEDLRQLLDHLAAQPHNRGDAVVTGFSQGGVLSYAVAVAGLPHVAAAVPLAGWLPPSLSSAPPSLPVYAFHGNEDRVVSYGAAKRMIAAWSDHREPLEFHSYPGLAHSVSAEMRRDWATALAELTRKTLTH